MVEWKKSPPELEARFDELLPDDPRMERRRMFGYASAFVNGHLCTGLFEDRLMLRLAEKERAQLLAIAGASVFEPMPGRPMREYVVVPTTLVDNTRTMRTWMRRAIAHVASLPPKDKNQTGKRAAKGSKRGRR